MLSMSRAREDQHPEETKGVRHKDKVAAEETRKTKPGRGRTGVVSGQARARVPSLRILETLRSSSLQEQQRTVGTRVLFVTFTPALPFSKAPPS